MKEDPSRSAKTAQAASGMEAAQSSIWLLYAKTRMQIIWQIKCFLSNWRDLEQTALISNGAQSVFWLPTKLCGVVASSLLPAPQPRGCVLEHVRSSPDRLL
jgi:hypothetical protein